MIKHCLGEKCFKNEDGDCLCDCEPCEKVKAHQKAIAPEIERCCEMRIKVQLFPVVIAEEACGVKDSVVTDFIVWESAVPAIAFKFCPWCGKPWQRLGQLNKMEGLNE